MFPRPGYRKTRSNLPAQLQRHIGTSRDQIASREMVCTAGCEGLFELPERPTGCFRLVSPWQLPVLFPPSLRHCCRGPQSQEWTSRLRPKPDLNGTRLRLGMIRELMADAPNGLPQISAKGATQCSTNVYAGANLREREPMQNQPIGTEPQKPPSPSLVDMLGDPRAVLMAIGLLGLALDLFVRPISLAGLALILLAATPWVLQAWALRNQRVASTNLGRAAETEAPHQRSTRAPNQGQRNDRSGQDAGVSKPERPSQSTADNVRKVQVAEAAARQLPRAAGGSEVDRRPVSPRSSEARVNPPRTA